VVVTARQYTQYADQPVVVVLDLPSTPPSLNQSGRANHFAQARLKKNLERDLGVLLMASGLPRGLQRVEATAVLRFPVKRRRDEGNHRWMLEKALGDTLTAGGWLTDDTPDRYSFGALEFDADLGPARTLVTLTTPRVESA
jgi:hypothetical protein